MVTFQSVILTSVYDIKKLKRKIRPDESHKTNSPWNIAADFTLDMSLSRDGIAGMLAEYEKDYHTGITSEKSQAFCRTIPPAILIWYPDSAS